MIKINLLPAESVMREAKPGRAPLVAAVLGVCVIGSLGWYVIQWRSLQGVKTRIQIAQRELQKYEDIVRIVDHLEQEKARLELKYNVILQLDRSKLLYPMFMERFVRVLPSTIGLRGLNTTSETTGIKFTLDGMAPDYYALADFMANLEGSPLFTNVELGSLSASSGQEGSKVWQFRLTGLYRPPNT